jgi:hypothetical protein
MTTLPETSCAVCTLLATMCERCALEAHYLFLAAKRRYIYRKPQGVMRDWSWKPNGRARA